MTEISRARSSYSVSLEFLISKTLPEGRRKLQKILENPPIDWVEKLKNIEETGTINVNGTWYHSRRDPDRETKRIVSTLESKKISNIILLGAGLGYVVHELYLEENIDFLLWIEPDPEMIYYFLNLFPIQNLKENPEKDFHILFPITGNFNDVIPLLRAKNINQTEIIPHLPSRKAKPSLYGPLEKKLKDVVEIRSINQATIIKFQEIWNKNIALNCRELLKHSTLNDYLSNHHRKYSNIVIAGAGPSLNDSMKELRTFRDRYYLICADTAFIPLAKSNILPDLVIGADPQSLNRYFAYSPNIDRTSWMLDPVVSYNMAHHLEKNGASLYWWDNSFYLDEIIRNSSGNRGEIAHGGSVSTNAYDLALKMEPEKIILVGQDLAYSDSLAHAKGAALEDRVFQGYNRFSNYEMLNFKQLKAHPLKPIIPISQTQGKIYTSAKLNVFIKWFEENALKNKKNTKPELWNATARGARLNGFHHASLSEILGTGAKITVLLQKEKKKKITPSLNDDLEKLNGEIIELKELYRKNLNNQIRLNSTGNPESKHQITLAMQKIDEKITTYQNSNNILALNAQHIILQITEGSQKDIHYGQKLYRAMLRSADQTLYLIKKMIRTLSFSET